MSPADLDALLDDNYTPTSIMNCVLAFGIAIGIYLVIGIAVWVLT